MQLKWEGLLTVLVNAVIRAASQKAVVEERREKVRRTISAVILKVHVVLNKMSEILSQRPFDNATFKKLLAKLIEVYKEVNPVLPEAQKEKLWEYAKGILRVAKAFDVEGGRVYPKDRCTFEKHVVLTITHLLQFRDSF